MDNTLSWYVEDLRDYLITLNDALIKMEDNLENKELINTIFRVAHSIKGNSAVMKLNRIKEVMHSMENILHDVRDSKRNMTSELVDVLYACHDFLEDCVEIIIKEETDFNVDTKAIMELINKVKDNDCFIISSDILELIQENINRGFELYHIKVDLSKDSIKSNNVNAKIISILRIHGHIIATLPKGITDMVLISSDIQLKHMHSEFLVLSEDHQNKMLDLLKDEVDVSRYECSKLKEQQIISLFENSKSKNMINTALKCIDEIKIEALDIRNEQVNNDAVEKILNNFKQISAIINNSQSYYAKMIITKICEILTKMEINKICFDANDMQNFVFLCNKLSELVQDPLLEINKEFISVIEDKIMCLVERCGQQRRRIGDILVDEGIISTKDVQDILDLQKNEYRNLKFGQVAVLGKKATADAIIQTLLKQNADNEGNQFEGKDVVRISAYKIDRLIKLVDELNDYHEELGQELIQEFCLTDFAMQQYTKITETLKEIYELSTTLKVVPIKNIFYKLTRITRETAFELGKKIIVTLEGENTEIDKVAAEKIADPLMHLVRNAISHGIEDEATRLSRGKQREGQVKLSAIHKQGLLHIEVSDDGGGIDTEAVYKKAVEKKMLDTTKAYSEEEILRLIFQPGLSTQETISSISGRGVGMDIVETELEKLKANVEIINTIGKGCTFIIKIPMNDTPIIK